MKIQPITPVTMTEEESLNGDSAFMCVVCGSRFKRTQEESILMQENGCLRGEELLCECDTKPMLKMLDVSVQHDSIPLLDKTVAKTASWFHATIVDDWHEKVSTGFEMYDGEIPYVHVGNLSAAMDMANHRYFEQEKFATVDLYEITLMEDAVLSDTVCDDGNFWYNHITERTREDLGGDAIRYVNKWESIGSISLLVDPRKIKVTKVTELVDPALNLDEMDENLKNLIQNKAA